MLLELLGSTAFGAITGGFFGWLTKREERESLKLKLDHEVSMVTAKTDAQVAISKMNIEEAQVAGALLVDKVEAQAFKESQKPRGVISETIKSVIRPLILGLLMWQSYAIIQSLDAIAGGLENIPETEVIMLYKIVVISIISLTSTAVGWYFSTRTSKQFDKLVDKMER